MTQQLPLRLVPINAVISLCRHDGWASTLADSGYRLVGLEIPVRGEGEAGTIRLDAVAAHADRDDLLAFECKSVANVQPAQVQRLADLDPNAVIRMASVSTVGGSPPTVEPVLVCMADHTHRVLKGLARANVTFVVLALGSTTLERLGAAFADPALQEAFAQPIPVAGPPPAYLAVDEHSNTEEFAEIVLAELVASMSHKRAEITVRAVTEHVIGPYARLGAAAQGTLRRKVDAAARQVAKAHAEFEYLPTTGTRQEAAVAILTTPEDSDPRGRPQRYQAIARKASNGRRRKRRTPEAEGQLDLDRLLEELDAGEDTAKDGVE